MDGERESGFPGILRIGGRLQALRVGLTMLCSKRADARVVGLA